MATQSFLKEFKVTTAEQVSVVIQALESHKPEKISISKPVNQIARSEIRSFLGSKLNAK